MKNDRREITSATVTVTLELSDLGEFGPGSIYEQAQEAIANKLIGLGVDAAAIKRVQVSSIDCRPAANPPGSCRQRLAAEGKPYPRSSCAVCGALSPNWRECDAIIDADSKGIVK